MGSSSWRTWRTHRPFFFLLFQIYRRFPSNPRPQKQTEFRKTPTILHLRVHDFKKYTIYNDASSNNHGNIHPAERVCVLNKTNETKGAKRGSGQDGHGAVGSEKSVRRKREYIVSCIFVTCRIVIGLASGSSRPAVHWLVTLFREDSWFFNNFWYFGHGMGVRTISQEGFQCHVTFWRWVDTRNEFVTVWSHICRYFWRQFQREWLVSCPRKSYARLPSWIRKRNY